ncbi:MAG: pyrroline-5-carboxylate reductase [Endozoicomonadaceae bacterium]|nr:pyrroline-5-carboxylate reductase [Endozoicomonadaceae bacterium]MBE8232772.1 pyrroline-5-carboxylate reductase [Endozoicomonadaceae bacterium]
MKKQAPKIAFIGAGNMANCIIQGLISNDFSPQDIIATRRQTKLLSELAEQGVQVTENNIDSIQQADIVVLGVKPFQIDSLVCKLKAVLLEKKPLLISLAVGVPVQQIDQHLKGQLAIVRLMPNLPIQVKRGVSIIHVNKTTSSEHRQTIQTIFSPISQLFWVEKENLIDLCASLAGSGPAYFYYFMEGLIEGACYLGIPEDMAKKMVLETAAGSLLLLEKKQEKISTLRKNVTSPGGTTEAALNAFKLHNFHASIRKSLEAAVIRAEKLSQSLM